MIQEIEIEMDEKDLSDHVAPWIWELMYEWLKDNPEEVYFDYNDKLSNGDIENILDGKENEVYENFRDGYRDYIWELEKESSLKCAEEFKNHILAGLTIDEDDVDWEEFVKESRLYASTHIGMDLDRLGRNARPMIAVNLQVEHPYMQHVYYDEVEEILDFFNVNPRTMFQFINTEVTEENEDDWPDIPERDGNEYVKPKDMMTEWINMFYSGTYVAMTTIYDLIKFGHKLHNPPEGMDTYVRLSKGTKVISHDYWNGSSGIGFRLAKDMLVKVEPHHISLDNGNKYGLQSVSGFIWEAWDSPIEIEWRKDDE